MSRSYPGAGCSEFNRSRQLPLKDLRQGNVQRTEPEWGGTGPSLVAAYGAQKTFFCFRSQLACSTAIASRNRRKASGTGLCRGPFTTLLQTIASATTSSR
jgi:hypothetical protein